MKEKWLQVQEKIDGLNQRERILILLTALVVLVMVLQTILLDPILAERDKAKRQIKQISNDLQTKNSEAILAQARLTVGVNRDKIRQRDQLKLELAELNKKIEESVVAMIPPRLMPEVLEKLLIESKGLKLLSLENKPVEAVITQGASTEGEVSADQQSLYNHGFVLRLSGDYLSAIRYFEKLSALPWRFHWDELSYKVDGYPDATIILEVHTVSMAEEWIGV